jgi:hypothetical protein
MFLKHRQEPLLQWALSSLEKALPRIPAFPAYKGIFYQDSEEPTVLPLWLERISPSFPSDLINEKLREL